MCNISGHEIMKSQNDIYKIINELRRDMLEYFEIIVRRLSRMRALEERLDIIEEDITDMRSKFRRLESFLKEIIEKERYTEEVPRTIYPRPRRTIEIPRAPIEQPVIEPIKPKKEEKREATVELPPIRPKLEAKKEKKVAHLIQKQPFKKVTPQVTEEDLGAKISKLTQTERQIIKVLIRYPNLKGGTSIARKIGKAREHTCRLLKKLTEKGLLIRDESVWPYAYKVPEKVKQIIMLEEELGYA